MNNINAKIIVENTSLEANEITELSEVFYSSNNMPSLEVLDEINFFGFERKVTAKEINQRDRYYQTKLALLHNVNNRLQSDYTQLWDTLTNLRQQQLQNELCTNSLVTNNASLETTINLLETKFISSNAKFRKLYCLSMGAFALAGGAFVLSALRLLLNIII